MPERPLNYLIAPSTANDGLTRVVQGINDTGAVQQIVVIEERPLTIFLNGQEIVTAMTIGDIQNILHLAFCIIRECWRSTKPYWA